ncbi:GNAT family N-acetyltransferase [Oceanobacillus saliphilus]|uniref:GNAT family N-acetyltransferase n=1 Tax=Oceanobacillus saliphilus TaxID=2925834 RepID=UPI00201E50C9|nr:GNAT family protein [Oceanobacillus saliphilus]
MFVYEVDENIVLRQLKLQDANELFQLTDHARDYLREWLPWVDTTVKPEDTLAFIDHTLKSSEMKSALTTGIIFKGKLVGLISFNSLDWANRIGYVGYWLSPDYQGNGIMTRAVRALTDYAFNTLGLNRVDIRAAYENKKSRAIPERLGFTEEGLIRHAEWLYDHYVDHVVYGMLASEWYRF